MYFSWLLRRASCLPISPLSSPFIIQQHYGFSPFCLQHLLCRECCGYRSGCRHISEIPPDREWNTDRMHWYKLVLAILRWRHSYSGCGFWTYELLYVCIALFMMGLTFTASTTLAMDCERRYAGAASALLGALCFASGGIVSPLVGLGDILLSTGVTFGVCAVCSLLCALWAVKRTALKGCGMPYLIHPTWHIYFDILWVIFLHAALKYLPRYDWSENRAGRLYPAWSDRLTGAIPLSPE